MVNGKMLTKAQLTEDYSILYKTLTHYHPNPFQYTSSSQFQSHFEEQMANMPDSLSERQFGIKAKKLIALLKCGHTVGAFSKAWSETLANKPLLIPLEFNRIENRLFVKNIDTTLYSNLHIGNEILSINQMPIKQILQSIDSLQQHDGLTQAFVETITPLYFKIYFLHRYGYSEQFELDFLSNSGELKHQTLKPQVGKLPPLPKMPLPTNFKVLNSNNWSVFAVDTSSQLAYLQIKSFSDRKTYKKYYQQVFEILATMPELHLIIDLRNNPGGFFSNGNKLLQYLSNEPFEFNMEKPKNQNLDVKQAKLGFWSGLTKTAFSLKPSKHKKANYRTYTFSYKPNKNAYTKPLSLITNGITFSQAALVAAQLKAQGALVFGSETGGTESGTNAMVQYQLRLPHSGFTTKIAHYHVVSNAKQHVFGFGVKPQHAIPPNFDLTHDHILLQVMDHLKNNRPQNR